MSNQAMVGRGIAAVGVVCGLIAIWTTLGGATKYWDDGTRGGLLLILGIVSGLLVLGAMVTDRRTYDVALGAVGGMMFGLYLWFPAVFAFNQWKLLDTGAWLGVCSGLIVIGAVVAVGPGLMKAGVRSAPVGAVIALAGLVLVVVAIWTKAADAIGKYWNVRGQGHSLGALMLILVILTALAIGAAYAGTIGGDPALLLASITAGLMLFLPVEAAFNDFGHLKVGGWLGGIGGIVLVLGVVAMQRMAPAGAGAPVTATAPPPPAA